MTFSLLAYDDETGAVGLSSASCWPAIGGIVPRFRPGVGVVATQHFAHLLMAETMLDELAAITGQAHPGHLSSSIENFAPANRQYAYATFKGQLFGWTGDHCSPLADHLADGDCLAIGNMLVSEEVLAAMVERFNSTSGPLADRLLSALMAGDAMGGDKRGRMSASLQVWSPDYPDIDECPIDFRVDLDERPIAALTEILTEYRAKPRPMPWRPSPGLTDAGR
ncbi:MAG: DUF1028 domain-containing protein [Pseudomonadota bacterium]